MKKHCYPLRIYYEDTDFNGFVYFTNYLKYMERACTQLIADGGINASELIEQDALIAVRSVHCDFLRPAKLDDEVEVCSYVTDLNDIAITWSQTIRSRQNPEQSYCQATIQRLCITQQLLPRVAPDDLKQAILPYYEG